MSSGLDTHLGRRGDNWYGGERTMKRVMVLCGLVLAGGMSMSLSGMQVTTGPTATSLAATKIERIKDNLYMITGSNVNPI